MCHKQVNVRRDEPRDPYSKPDILDEVKKRRLKCAGRVWRKQNNSVVSDLSKKFDT